MTSLTMRNGKIVLHGLSPKHLKMLRFIRQTQLDHGYSPSYDEIANHMGGISRGNVNALLKVMQKRGFVQREPGARRHIEVRIPVGV